jgi:hypothetical protein
MTKKGYEIEKGRINEICKELNRFKTYQGLKKFLIRELEFTQECINEKDIDILSNQNERIRKEIFKKLDRKWDSSKKNKIKLKTITEIKTKEEARQIAMSFQEWQSDKSLFYSELIEFNNYFETLANKFNLIKEFKENGII